jgi:hypothetical protein
MRGSECHAFRRKFHAAHSERVRDEGPERSVWRRGMGSSTGRTLCGGRFVPNRKNDPGKIDTNGSLKLHDLHVLMTVVQAGSMSKAAALLNTGQPAISRSIADLEQTIGIRLLERNPQGVEPTEYGRALLAGGAAVFAASGGEEYRVFGRSDGWRRKGRKQ